MTYWHMQMHPNSISLGDKYVARILEREKIIGLGKWDEGAYAIELFKKQMQINDIVAIKNGAKLIALVQVAGECHFILHNKKKKKEPIDWIRYTRSIRVLDWEIDETKTIPHAQGTLTKCVDENAATTKIIKDWHNQVVESFLKRKVPLTVR